MGRRIRSIEEFDRLVNEIEGRHGYRRPLAFGIGIAHTSQAGDILDTFFPVPNYLSNFGTAAVLANIVGHLAGTQSHFMMLDQLEEIMNSFAPFENDGQQHDNIDAIKAMFAVDNAFYETHGSGKRVVVSFIDQPQFDPGPQTVPDAYLRLHLLSHRLVKPNQINLDGIFSVLPNNVWTNEGPIAQNDLKARQLDAMMRRHPIRVFGVDKFPCMTDYVIPSGVRIANAAQVRLGAHLAEGTTVMQAGFCNFNAGTQGTSMVEGRISSGVVVGEQTDIGGGASIMGTLSGGGTEKISIGPGCLIGANAGIGISLGKRCVVEAGLYITAGMPVVYNGTRMRARDLSGRDGLTFIRNSMTGAVEALDRPNKVVLNEQLHKN